MMALMQTDLPAHPQAFLRLHTGSSQFVRPSLGAWAAYGLGSENENLPGFITICPTLAHGGVNNWGAAFLPAWTQGTHQTLVRCGAHAGWQVHINEHQGIGAYIDELAEHSPLKSTKVLT